jgi:hypothetical protein
MSDYIVSIREKSNLRCTFSAAWYRCFDWYLVGSQFGSWLCSGCPEQGFHLSKGEAGAVQ